VRCAVAPSRQPNVSSANLTVAAIQLAAGGPLGLGGSESHVRIYHGGREVFSDVDLTISVSESPYVPRLGARRFHLFLAEFVDLSCNPLEMLKPYDPFIEIGHYYFSVVPS
jgi:hypothetical protein